MYKVNLKNAKQAVDFMNHNNASLEGRYTLLPKNLNPWTSWYNLEGENYGYMNIQMERECAAHLYLFRNHM